ncbi:ABC transporter permease [Streptomyces meridianus]|uniref:ABC transporter permease n=1 Tax=Streptomyces meridianus TaxID=2938945 RepID=A0ABT0X9X7_9ACTN|nr:ABC transporter permease [Streptomyces meridianus]MCM2579331.1 ABC transporter permease [Streptomyces meridianus]
MIRYAWLEVRRTLREPAFVIFGVGMPVLMYLLFTRLGGGADGDWAATAMVGMAAYGALGSALSQGTVLAEDKTLGWLRQLRVTPLRPVEIVAGRALTASVVVLPAIVVVLAAGALVNGVSLHAWQWGALAFLLWIGTAPFTLLGLGNGYHLSAQTTGLVNMGCTLLLSIIGGLWFPSTLLPDWLGGIAQWTPAHSFAELGLSVTRGSHPTAGTVSVLAGWLLLFGGYAVHAYRRSARRV